MPFYGKNVFILNQATVASMVESYFERYMVKMDFEITGVQENKDHMFEFTVEYTKRKNEGSKDG